MVGQDLEDALGIITDDEEDRKGADRRVILVQDHGWLVGRYGPTKSYKWDQIRPITKVFYMYIFNYLCIYLFTYLFIEKHIYIYT